MVPVVYTSELGTKFQAHFIAVVDYFIVSLCFPQYLLILSLSLTLIEVLYQCSLQVVFLRHPYPETHWFENLFTVYLHCHRFANYYSGRLLLNLSLVP